jgi:hypothetical protein
LLLSAHTAVGEVKFKQGTKNLDWLEMVLAGNNRGKVQRQREGFVGNSRLHTWRGHGSTVTNDGLRNNTVVSIKIIVRQEAGLAYVTTGGENKKVRAGKRSSTGQASTNNRPFRLTTAPPLALQNHSTFDRPALTQICDRDDRS